MAGRKLRPNYRSQGTLDVIASLLRSRFTTFINCGILLLLIAIATALIYYEANYVALNIKTVAGDNLRPTPWHKFPLPDSDNWNRASRLPTILKCNYLSCLSDILGPISHTQFHSNLMDLCPSFFQWIYEDLSPWRHNKITRESLKAAQQHAAFRVVIVGGRLYIEFYYACVLPRALFTLWGLLQLLEKYPGMVPDVDLMFDCMDRPSVKKADYEHKGSPPPLFRYCGHKEAYDIPFPDWSFWGWPQIDISPWTEEVQSIYSSSKVLKWEDRKPNAYWKGNPDVGSKVREDLLRCNKTKDSDWGAEIYRQNWWAEGLDGFRNSKLSQQCKHRYKIYTEGHAWSVSFKYIFACDSPVLVAIPTYHEFFTRGLIPTVHYWPIRRDRLCPSIKFAVNWGNEHPTEAKAIGNAGQEFIWRNLTMDYVLFFALRMIPKSKSF
ncbi:hypothetical protein GOP47_0021881 [Adiantum capillus-veneris]|uniref:Glycosyl transferase CAP10 domain-containing protein n=1 Tax=Adiantum capillus-veneris TaxID=13818 RepID=A0A9D4U897_ADICA|nr:hypothetical protein GOP47_0021881 [Adiantum capillus-veneris]